MIEKKNTYLLIITLTVNVIYCSNLFANNNNFTEYKLYPVAKNINVRLAPNSNLIIQGVELSPNKPVKVLGCSTRVDTKWIGRIGKHVKSRWAKIEGLNGLQGWVFAYLLRDSEVSNPTNRKKSDNFYKNLPDDFIVPCDFLERTIFMQYGALFVAKGVKLPKQIIFNKESELKSWQEDILSKDYENGSVVRILTDCRINNQIGNTEVPRELQQNAMKSFRQAMLESNNLVRTRCDKDAARRSIKMTKRSFLNRVESNLNAHLDQVDTNTEGDNKLSRVLTKLKNIINEIRAKERANEDPSYYELLLHTIELEQTYNKCFGAGREKSVIYSNAPPGASQHHSMLAMDHVTKRFFVDVDTNLGKRRDFSSDEKNKITNTLARNGWFRTVFRDRFHFTYLGVTFNGVRNLDFQIKKTLEKLGLKKEELTNYSYWVPQDWQEFKCK